KPSTITEYPGCEPGLLAPHDFDLNTKLSKIQVSTSDLDAQFLGELAPVRQWTHLVFVRDGTGEASLYVNGATDPITVSYSCDPLLGSTTAPTGLLPLDMGTGGVLSIGQSMARHPDDPADPLDADNQGKNAFEGVLDELAIFDRALTQPEV